MTSAFSWQNSVSLCPASFCTPRPNLPVNSKCFLTSCFSIPVLYNEKDIFFRCQSKRSCRSSQNCSASSAFLVGAQTWITMILNGLLWKINSSVSFLWLSNFLLCICTTTSLSVHLSMDIQVASIFQLAIMNNEKWDTCVSFNFGFLRVYAQEWDYWVIWWFYSWFVKESPYHLPQWLCQFTFPPTVHERSLFSTPSPAFTVCRLF